MGKGNMGPGLCRRQRRGGTARLAVWCSCEDISGFLWAGGEAAEGRWEWFRCARDERFDVDEEKSEVIWDPYIHTYPIYTT